MNKALFNPPVLLTAVFSLAATVVVTLLIFGKPEPPTLMLDEPMAAPDFTVTDHLGNTVTKQSMLGKVWVCDFFLTRCNGICPILGRNMANLAETLGQDNAFKDVQLISFSVDPDYDTVAQLKLYRERNMGIWAGDDKAKQAEVNTRWRHARAEDKQAFWELVREGFNLYVGPAENDPTTPVAHSGRFVLIDAQGNIRGYYDGMTTEQTPALLADIRRLVKLNK